ncbi:MAG: prenyltransferase [Treponema sp.]
MPKGYCALTPRMAVQLAAPHTWVASLFPALFGVLVTAFEGRVLSVPQMVLLAGACILLQASVNTLNDYADFVKGTDSRDDCVEKTDSVLVYHAVHPRAALCLGIFYLVLGGVFGVFACRHAGAAPLYIGLIGGVTVILYSAGLVPISYLPLGELTSGLVMGGLIPLGVAAAADGALHLEILPYTLPLVIGIALIMLSNNGSDIEKDQRAGRKTLPVCIGRKNTVVVYRVLIVVWLILLWVLPMWKLGYTGVMSGVALIFVWHTVFIRLIKAPLLPERRIQQMKTIVLANICGNGVYIAAFAIKLVVKKYG